MNRFLIFIWSASIWESGLGAYPLSVLGGGPARTPVRMLGVYLVTVFFSLDIGFGLFNYFSKSAKLRCNAYLCFLIRMGLAFKEVPITEEVVLMIKKEAKVTLTKEVEVFLMTLMKEEEAIREKITMAGVANYLELVIEMREMVGEAVILMKEEGVMKKKTMKKKVEVEVEATSMNLNYSLALMEEEASSSLKY